MFGCKKTNVSQFDGELLLNHYTLPWSQRFSFATKRRDKSEKEAARENLW